MPSLKAFWVVLVVAVAQALLAGTVAVTRADPPPVHGSLTHAPDGAAVDSDASPSPSPVLSDSGPETPLAGDPAAVTPPVEAQTTVAPPSPAGAPRYPVLSEYSQLSEEEAQWVANGPPYETLVEGRVVGTKRVWRTSGFHRPDGKICSEIQHWNPDSSSGGSGSGDCMSASEWAWGAGGPEDLYGFNGFAPVAASTIRIVGHDGSTAEVPGVHRADMGVTFFVAWVNCDAPDIERFEAVRDGRVVSTHSMAPIEMPSMMCNF